LSTDRSVSGIQGKGEEAAGAFNGIYLLIFVSVENFARFVIMFD
jgi:hypothetical protein